MKKKKAAPGQGNGRTTATNIDKNTRYSKSSAVKLLELLANEAAREIYPDVPYLAPRIFRDDSANGLTKCITAFLKLKGWQADRINNTGRPQDTRRTFTDVLGNQRTIGTLTWLPGTGTRGISDIVACIDGRLAAIEVKIGTDRQRPAQKEYQQRIEAAGGLYYIARDFESFLQWYNQKFA